MDQPIDGPGGHDELIVPSLLAGGRVWELVTKRASQQLPASSTRVSERAPNPPPRNSSSEVFVSLNETDPLLAVVAVAVVEID